MILGYISELKENHNKIVVILNEDMLLPYEKTILQKHKEKVFDMEISFSPSSDHNQNLIFDTHQYIEIIKNSLRPMFVKNLRILKLIKTNIDHFLQIINKIENIDIQIKKNIIHKITFNTWLHYQSGINITIDELEIFFFHRKNISKEKEAVRQKLNNYEYGSFADYEKEIINYLLNGYYNEDDFLIKIKTASDIYIKNTERTLFDTNLKSVWGLYNDNFLNDQITFITNATNFIKLNIEKFHYYDIQQLIEYIKTLSPEEDTQTLIDLYIRAHILTLTQNEIKFFTTQTTDEDIIAKLNQKIDEIIERKSIKSTIYNIVTKSSWHIEDEEFLDLHSQKEIYEWLVTETDSELLLMLRGSLNIFPNTNGESTRESFGRKLNAALLQVAERSIIDKLRITKYLGIQIPKEEKAD